MSSEIEGEYMSAHTGQGISVLSLNERGRTVRYAYPKNLFKQTPFFCLNCGLGCELAGKSGAEATDYAYEHARKFHDVHVPRTSIHVGLDKKARVCAKEVPLLWAQDQVESLFSVEAQTKLTRTEGHTCLSCLFTEVDEREHKKYVCCSDKKPRAVTILRAKRAQVHVVLDDGSPELAAAFERYLSRPEDEPAANETAQQVTTHKAQSSASSSASSSAPLTFERAVIASAEGSARLTADVLPANSGGVFQRGAHGTYLQMADVIQDQSLLARKWNISSLGAASASTRRTGTLSEKAKEVLVEGSSYARLDSDASRRQLALSHHLSRTDSKDIIITALASAFIVYSFNVVIAGVHFSLLREVSAAPKHVTGVGFEQADESNRAQRDWSCTQATLNERGRQLAKILKVISVNELAGRKDIDHAIEKISARLNQARNQGKQDPVSAFVQIEEIEAVHKLLQSILSSPSDGMVSAISAPFAFRLCPQRGGANVQDDDDDDEDDKTEEELLGSHALPDPQGEIQAATCLVELSTISQALSMMRTILFSFKLTLGMSLVENQAKINQAFEKHSQNVQNANDLLLDIELSNNASIARDDAVRFADQLVSLTDGARAAGKEASSSSIKLIREAVEGKPALLQVVTALSRLKNIEASRPSAKNNVAHVGENAEGPIFNIAGSLVDGTSLAVAGKAMMNDLCEGAIECLGPGSRDIVTDVFYNPDCPLLRLEVGTLRGTSPRLAVGPLKPLLEKIEPRSNAGIALLESYRRTVLAGLYFASGFTPRSGDLRLLDLGTTNTPGNVLAASHETAESGGSAIPPGVLPFVISKTQEYAVGVIPSRLLLAILFMQDVLLGLNVDSVVETLCANVKDEDTRRSISRTDLRRALLGYLRRFPAATTRLKRDASLIWREAKGVIVICEQTRVSSQAGWSAVCTSISDDGTRQSKPLPFEDDLFQWLHADEISQIVVDVVAKKWLRLQGETTYSCIRPLFVTVRAMAGQYMEAKFRHAKPNTPPALFYDFLMKTERQSAENYERAKGAHSTGLHSFDTMMNSYYSAAVLSPHGQSIRVPEFKLQASESMMRRMEVMLSIPCKHGGILMGDVRKTLEPDSSSGSQHLLGPRASIWDIWQRARPEECKDMDVSAALTAALRRNHNMEMLDSSQLESMKAVALAKSGECVLIAAGCGSGKTISAIFPSSCVGGISIFVCPYVALVQSVAFRLKTMGLNASVFDPNANRFRANSWSDGTRETSSAKSSAEIILCTTDAFSSSQELHGFLSAARLASALRVIVFDEAHQLILGAVYRDCMNHVASRVRCLDVPLVLLSGTCPEAFVPSLLQRLGLGPNRCTVVRSSKDSLASKRSISFINIPGETTDLLSALTMMLEKSDARRIIVFCLTHDAVEEAFRFVSSHDALTKSFKILKMTSALPDVDRERCLQELQRPFVEEKRLICISTSILAEGPDVEVDETFIIGAMHLGPLHVLQATSRAGRGDPSKVGEVRGTVLMNNKYVFAKMPRGCAEEADANVLKLFQADARADGLASILTQRGLEQVLALVTDGNCGRVALRSVYTGQDPTKVRESLSSCGKCSSCNVNRWIYGPCVKKDDFAKSIANPIAPVSAISSNVSGGVSHPPPRTMLSHSFSAPLTSSSSGPPLTKPFNQPPSARPDARKAERPPTLAPAAAAREAKGVPAPISAPEPQPKRIRADSPEGHDDSSEQEIDLLSGQTAVCQSDATNTRVLVTEWAKKKGTDIKSCILCAVPHPGPNYCKKLEGLLPRGFSGRCRYCFAFGHDWTDKSGPNPKPSKCQLIVSKEDPEYQHLKVCTLCWVPHASKECPFSRTAVRTCITWLLIQKTLDERFYCDFRHLMRMEKRLEPGNLLKDFESLTRWCVFRSLDGLPNSFRLMAFVKEHVG